MATKKKTGNTHVPSGTELNTDIERLHGVELTAALFLRTHLFGMDENEQQEVMRRVAHDGAIDSKALVDVLNSIKKAAISEMNGWLQNPCTSKSLARCIAEARDKLAAEKFALLKSGVTPAFARFLMNLQK